MLRPVGSQPPSVYWRRRLMLLAGIAGVLILIVVTISAATGSDTSTKASGPSPRKPTTQVSTPTPTTRSSKSTTSSPAPGSPSPSGSAAAPKACVPSALSVAATVGKSTYKVGGTPLVQLQVTNTGSSPCVQDLSDKQIDLRVYNGTSRVWGSHDCAVQPGTDDRMLAVGRAYTVGIVWSGLTSEVGCKQATRQKVGAGTYTLYARLSGHLGRAAQFSIG